MAKLTEVLLDPGRKREVIRDCVQLLEEEVASKHGLSGFAVKAGFKTVKAITPGFLDKAIENLLPDFAVKLEAFREERDAKAPSEPLARYLPPRAGAVADALLSVTDARAARADRGVVRSAYERLRPSARRNVEEAVPRLGRLADKYVK